MVVAPGFNFPIKIVPQLIDVNPMEVGGLKIEGKDRTGY
jgi:hypothetical protein